ncbi:MAG: adenylate/guanylate cyclase domain-containing protein [Alphaproteobacteria bacterium]
MNIRSIAVIALLLAAAPTYASAQTNSGENQMMGGSGMTMGPMGQPPAPTPFYAERTFLVLFGLGLGAAAFLGYRAARGRWNRSYTAAGFVSEAVLVVDLVSSTHLATHYGDGLAMRARNVLKERTLALAEARGLTFAENTGDGCFMTFPSVISAGHTAIELLKEFRDRPPDLSPAPTIAVRAGISYGEILLDTRGARHSATINKAFRLEGLSRDSFTQVEGENNVAEFADRNRIYIDEEAAQELQKLGGTKFPVRFLGFARLKGFSGLHRVYEVLWSSMDPTLSEQGNEEHGAEDL